MAKANFSQEYEALTTALFDNLQQRHQVSDVAARVEGLVMGATVLPSVVYTDRILGSYLDERSLHGHVEAFAKMLGADTDTPFDSTGVDIVFSGLVSRIYQRFSGTLSEAV